VQFDNGRLEKSCILCLVWLLAFTSLLAPKGLAVLLLAFVVPIILLAQLSALLDKLGEHAWLTARNPSHGQRYYHASSTWGRYCGCAVPASSMSWQEQMIAWPQWFALMLFYHLPSRLLVIVGDLPNHDFHHRYPSSPDWMVSAYARQADIDSGVMKGPPYSEIWGMFQAVDRMFQGMSEAPVIIATSMSQSDVGEFLGQ